MNKITSAVLNKLRILDVLIVFALLVFLLEGVIVSKTIIKMFQNPFLDAETVILTMGMAFITLLYKPAILVAAAKIIHLLGQKNASN